MTVALALLAGAALIAVALPRLLWRLHRTRVDPRWLIAGWVASGVGVLGTAIVACVLLLLPGHGVPGGLVHAVHGCWTAVSHGSPPRAEQVSGLVGTLVLVAVGIRLGLVGRRQATRRRQARDERLVIVRLAGHSDAADPPTLWLEHSRPLAFSLGGRRGLVVATEGLAEQLTPREMFAVLEHERAHVRGRHHLLLGTAETVASVLPFVPLLRQAFTALRDLVELAADATAARRCGTRALRDALTRVAEVDLPDLPPTALAAGNHAIELRLHRLSDPGPTRGRVRRAFGACVVGTALVVSPVVAGVAMFALAVAVFCPAG